MKVWSLVPLIVAACIIAVQTIILQRCEVLTTIIIAVGASYISKTIEETKTN
jgi:hypothetical protein